MNQHNVGIAKNTAMSQNIARATAHAYSVGRRATERENAVEQHQDVPYAEIIIQHGAKTAHTTKGKDWHSSLKLKKKFPSTQRGIWLQHKCNSLIQSSKAEIGFREEITMQANR